jgi:hypothetical protein
MRDWHWSPAEKAVAHRAFDLALHKELEAVLHQARKRAAEATEASDLWKLEAWLGHRRREIDSKYDFRYSVLPMVFGGLLHEGSISEDDLRGLGQEKLDAIRRIASFR